MSSNSPFALSIKPLFYIHPKRTAVLCISKYRSETNHVLVRSSREYFQVRTYLVVPDFVLCVRLGQLIPHTEKYSSTLQVTRARDIRPPIETHASIFSHSIRLLLIAQSNDDAFHCSSCTILVDTTSIQTTTLLLRTMMR